MVAVKDATVLSDFLVHSRIRITTMRINVFVNVLGTQFAGTIDNTSSTLYIDYMRDDSLQHYQAQKYSVLISFARMNNGLHYIALIHQNV